MHGILSLATAVPVTETVMPSPFGHVTSALQMIVADPCAAMVTAVGMGAPLISVVHGKPLIATLRLASPQLVTVSEIWTGPLSGRVTWLSLGEPSAPPLLASISTSECNRMLHATQSCFTNTRAVSWAGWANV